MPNPWRKAVSPNALVKFDSNVFVPVTFNSRIVQGLVIQLKLVLKRCETGGGGSKTL